MTPKEMADFLTRIILPYEKAPAIFIWGPPGIGKSAVVKQVAESAGIGFIDMRLATKDPTDLRGIPVPKKGKAVWLPPSELPSEKEGLLFLDELTLAPPLVQSSAYQLVLDKRLGEYILPPGWRIVAAGNRPEHGANVYKMAYALRNRFTHLEFEVSVQDWRDWAIRTGIESEIIEFISFRPDLLFQFDPKRNEDAYASPRTWAFASDHFHKRDLMTKKVLHETIGGTVSKACSAEFFAFLEIRESLPKIEDILNGENFVPDRIDIAYALVTALAVRAEPIHFARLLEYSKYLPAETSAVLAKMLLARDKNALIRLPLWKSFSIEHRELLAE